MATSAFTHRHDAPEVVRLQRKVFHEKVTTSKEVRLQWLPYEELDRLIEALPHFQELRVFRLNHFQATMAQLEALGQVLAAKELQTLEIGHCKEFYGFNCGLRGLGKAIAASLEVNRTIRKVDLSGNSIGVEGAQALLAALRNNRRVKIVLDKDHFSRYSKEVQGEIEKLVEANKGEDNEEAPEDESKIGAFPSPPRIKHLADWILAQNKGVDLIGMSGRQKGDEEVKALAAALKENRQVRRVELQNNGFGDAGAEALAEMLHQNRTIKEIVLSSNRITTVGAKALLEALRVNKVVTYISLDDNGEISEEVRTEIWEIVGANKVAAYVLTLNESVTEIDLRCKEFGAEGMKVLTAALKENKQVTKINLCRCIGDVGAQALAEMLHQNRTIKTIVLRSNRITTVGAKALLEALRVNKVVTYISLDKNGDISEEVKKEIEEVLEAQVEEEGEVFDFSMQKSGGGLGFDAVLRHCWRMFQLSVAGRDLSGLIQVIRLLFSLSQARLTRQCASGTTFAHARKCVGISV
ncbi:unnamed protein product [Durusdinium trenchii]|uniref:Uncharacterized protein n=1 Tax=Durusdinium trenchii TaxID=1381693 RepID=A0ABP0R095_9DINO